MPFGGGGGGVSLPISIANGGTGQTTAAAALAALGGVGAGAHAFTKGTASGSNYSSTSTSFVAIDATHLDATLTVPVGSVALAIMTANPQSNAGHTSRLGIAIDGTIYAGGNMGGSTPGQAMTVVAALAGDGSSHVFSPRFQTDSGGTVTIANNSSPAFDGPTLSVLVVPAS